MNVVPVSKSGIFTLLLADELVSYAGVRQL